MLEKNRAVRSTNKEKKEDIIGKVQCASFIKGIRCNTKIDYHCKECPMVAKGICTTKQ